MNHTVTKPISGVQFAPKPALYALPDILERGKFSKSHLYNLVARGHFPKPCLVVGPRFTRWSSADVDAFFADPASYIAANAMHK